MNNSKNTELQNLFVDQLRDILWAEKQLLKALPKKAAAAKDPKLKKAFESHAGETELHISRLNSIFEFLGLAPRAKKCDAMEGLLREGDALAEEYTDSTALDAALICAAQKVEHYEIATYGTLKAYSEVLGHGSATTLLAQTLDEESQADETLSKISRSVNAQADT
jgi:ferritin-like metal-binding protein YciE